MADPVGVVEIAARMGVSRDAVNQWRRRETGKAPFPEPQWTVGGRPAWDWPAVVAWIEATGRTLPS